MGGEVFGRCSRRRGTPAWSCGRTACLRIFALLALWASPFCYGAGDSDLRPIPEQSPLSGRLGALGVVMLGEPGHVHATGTGFLVSSCHVLTAGHVIGSQGSKSAVGTQVRFAPIKGTVAVALDDRSVRGAVVAAGESATMPGAPVQAALRNTMEDWALIELDRPISDIDPFKILYRGAQLSASIPVSVVGYTLGSYLFSVYAHENCRIRGDLSGADLSYRALVADCAVREGMSGGPMLVDLHGQLVALGIVSQRVEVGSKVAVLAVSARSFGEKIASAMRSSQVCAVGQPFALPLDVVAAPKSR